MAAVSNPPIPHMETYVKKTYLGTDVRVSIHSQATWDPGNSGASFNAGITFNDDDPLQSARDMESNPRPTVLILGWFAASKRSMAKYESVYHSMGYNTVSTTAPSSIVYSISRSSPLPYVMSIFRVLAADERLYQGGLVLAPFSHGGAVIFPLISALCNLDDTHPATPTANTSSVHPDMHRVRSDDLTLIATIRSALAAIVFDSSPCFMHTNLAADAIVQGSKLGGTWLGNIVWWGFQVFVQLQMLFLGDSRARYWEHMRTATYPCPETYLYSTDDLLLDVEALDALIVYRKERNIAKGMDIWRIENAVHVQLLRSNRDAYIERLRRMNDKAVNAFRRSKGLEPWHVPSTSMERPS